MNKLQETYLTVWKRMFSDILGWSEQETLEWAKKFEEYLQDPYDWLYHADPPYWAVATLVPVSQTQKLTPNEFCSLRNELLAIFPVELYLASYLDVDWKQYKSQIDVIVEKYAH